MPSIARKNLLLDIPRFLVAQAGIMFAVSLVTIQTGLQGGFARSSSLLIDKSRADIWVSSEQMEHVGLTLPISYDRVIQAQKVAGVATAEGLILRGNVWRNSNNSLSSITIVGFEPQGKLFAPWNITKGSINDLKKPYSVMIDESGLDDFNIKGIGDSGKLGSLNAQVVGLTQGVQSVVFGNLIFSSLQSANTFMEPPRIVPCELAPWEENCVSSEEPVTNPPIKQLSASDPISFVLVQAKPGQDLEILKQRLEEALQDTRAYTSAEMSEKTQHYWQNRSGIGFILGIGAVVGIVVGVVIVGQILYSSVTDHIKEFGTLKAMGASDWVIYGVIIEQALWMAVLGYVPGMALCLGVASWTSATQAIMILITPGSAIAVLGITVLMCTCSALFAIQKVTRVDPGIVFKA